MVNETTQKADLVYARLDPDRLLADGVVHGDALELVRRLERESVDLFFMSPPYADQRPYSRIHPIARAMFDATTETGSLVLNIKNRIARTGSHNQADIEARFGVLVTPAPDFVVFDKSETLRACRHRRVLIPVRPEISRR